MIYLGIGPHREIWCISVIRCEHTDEIVIEDVSNFSGSEVSELLH